MIRYLVNGPRALIEDLNIEWELQKYDSLPAKNKLNIKLHIEQTVAAGYNSP